MNVSSVKNLNGETFSAVQDATLTDVVQTNSGNWQDITAYQSNSANYLTEIPSDLDLNNISANNVVFKTITETIQGEVSTAFTADLTDYGWAIGCGISTNTIGYSSLDMKLSADLPITGTNYITIGAHQEYNEHFAAWKVPYDQIGLMNTLKLNEYSAHFQSLSNSLTGSDNITYVNVLDEGTSTMSTGVGNFVVSYPGIVTQPLTFSSFYTNYGNTSSMLSGAIDYVSAHAGGGGGGTTYTSPSGTILINDDTLEATTSAIGTTVRTVEPTISNSYFSAIPGYPFDSYSAQKTDDGNYLYLRYGDWYDGFEVNMTVNTMEIPLTSGGYDLWLYNGSNVRISAVKTGVVELAKKDDLSDYTTNVEKNALSASISSVSSNLYELSGKTFTGSNLGTILVEGQNIEASTSAITQVADTTATTYSETVSVTSMPNYPYSTYKFSFGQNTNSVHAIYGNWAIVTYLDYNPQDVTIPASFNGYDLNMVGYGEGVLSGIKSSVVELALKNDLPSYEYDDTNKISAINGSALAGGGEGLYVPLSARSLSIGTFNYVGTQTMTQAFAHGTNNTAQYNGYSFGGYNSANSNCLSVGTRNYTNKNSVAVGYYNTATNVSQAFGDHVSATNSGMAIGTYNIITTGAFVIGNGSSGNPSDCFIIEHDGNVSAMGDIKASGMSLQTLWDLVAAHSASWS